MKNTADQTIPKYKRVLIWGKPGAGKTELAATFPDPIFFDTDSGMATISNPGFRTRHPGVNVDYETYEEALDNYGMFKHAKAVMDLQKDFNTVCKEGKHKTLVFDSLTTLQELCMNVGYELNEETGRSKSLKKGRDSKHKIILPTIADFGTEGNVFSKIINTARAQPMHLVCIAHEREDRKENVVVSVEPHLLGSRIRALVCHWFDEIWYLDTVPGGNRILYTQPYALQKVNRTRFGIPNKLINPTWAKIQEAVDALSKKTP